MARHGRVPHPHPRPLRAVRFVFVLFFVCCIVYVYTTVLGPRGRAVAAAGACNIKKIHPLNPPH